MLDGSGWPVYHRDASISPCARQNFYQGDLWLLSMHKHGPMHFDI